MMMMMVMLNDWPVGRADSDQGRDVPTQAGALHGTVQALVQFVAINLGKVPSNHYTKKDDEISKIR